MTRATIMIPVLVAIPPSSEPARSRHIEMFTVWRSPSTRTIHELASIATVAAARFAVDSHWASAWLMPKAPMMSGIATLMIVPASIAATLPVTVVSRANQRYSMPQARNPAARPSLGGSRAM